jgi:hypothetical protein
MAQRHSVAVSDSIGSVTSTRDKLFNGVPEIVDRRAGAWACNPNGGSGVNNQYQGGKDHSFEFKITRLHALAC